VAPTPIAAICLLSRYEADHSGPPVTIERIHPAPAFSAVLANAHEFDPTDADRRARMLRAYLDLVAVVPVFDVRFRPGPEHFAHLLDAVVDVVGLGQPVAPPVCVA
jgi:hypothetical protein